MSTLTILAEAVKTELEGASLSQSFTAVRAYRPRFTVADLTTLRVVVVARNCALEARNRVHDDHDCVVEISILKHIGGTLTNEQVDPYMDFVEEVVDFLRRRPLSDVPQATYKKAAYEVPYDDEEMERKQTFEALVSVMYRVTR